jgi:signal transduction histidine kinase
MSDDIDSLRSVIASQQAELASLQAELAETNKGVVALYAELDDNALQLREAADLKSCFLSYMSHEFRTPLASITSIAGILLDGMDGPLTNEQQRQLKFVKGSVRELTEMVDDLLDFAKEGISGVRILVATDVTQKLRAEEARESLLASERAARSEAERSNRLKEEFLATLSHELRNPLNAILGWATLLNRKPGLPASVTHGLQAIERNSRFQAQMISDLLDYAGVTFGKMRLIAETIDPYPVIRAALDVVSGPAQLAGVEVDASFEDEALSIEADPARLQQIVWNLLSNAVKFSAKGGRVTLRAGRSGECLTLVVADHGRGIEPEFLPRIFERFSQQDATTTRSHGGLGLGLAIVKQLAELHGGSIQAFSGGKGTGATFTMSIPLSRLSASLRRPAHT